MIVVAVIALGEPVRALRHLNVPAGAAIAGLVLVTSADTGYAAVVAVSGVAVAGPSLRRGVVRESYGRWRLMTR